MTTPEPTPLQEALVRWLFPKGLDHPGHWSLTNEGAREIARAALATPPAALDVERLARAHDAHWRENIGRQHCDDDCYDAIAAAYQQEGEK